MFRLFSQNNQGSNGLSGNVKKLSKITYEANRFLSNHWQAGAGEEKRVVRPSFFVGDDLPLSLALLHAAGRPVAKPS